MGMGAWLAAPYLSGQELPESPSKGAQDGRSRTLPTCCPPNLRPNPQCHPGGLRLRNFNTDRKFQSWIDNFNLDRKSKPKSFLFAGPSWCTITGLDRKFDPRSIAQNVQPPRLRSNLFQSQVPLGISHLDRKSQYSVSTSNHHPHSKNIT